MGSESEVRYRPDLMGRSRAVLVIALVAAALVVAGHYLFLFTCDDAYIAFRYVSNRQLGHGYVWNAPPFRPVEGYTSFLWIALLDVVWTVTGLDPTRTANPLSLGFSLAATAVVGWWAWRMPLRGGLRDARVAVFGVVLLGTATNRTWLAWTTSGLETALFNCLLVAWMATLALSSPTRRSFAALTGLGALIALTRPDGLLYIAATAVAWALWASARRRDGSLRTADALPLLPLLLPVAHLLWRRATYGFWLPNTYYAKHVGAWPQVGLPYAASFAMEYAAWLPLALVLAALAVVLRRDGWRPSLDALSRLALVAAPVAHWAYYTLLVGGDHFEYRIYVHLVPLCFLGAAWALDRLTDSRTVATATLLSALLLSWPVPWGHYAISSQFQTRPEIRAMKADLAPHTPMVLRPYTRAFDRLQAYLRKHKAGIRHQAHKVFIRSYRRRYPSREKGMQVKPDGIPVIAMYSVGVPAWTLPHVAVIDRLGLNDLVVARNPVPDTKLRTMAHDRRPPPGYEECFRPNVEALHRKVTVRDRVLTAEEVRRCEQTFFDQVQALQGGEPH